MKLAIAGLGGAVLLTAVGFAYEPNPTVTVEGITVPQHQDIRKTPEWRRIKARHAQRCGVRVADGELDHIVPCCLGRCDNSAENLQIQPWSAAVIKDEEEIRTCSEYRHRQIGRTEALAHFRREHC